VLEKSPFRPIFKDELSAREETIRRMQDIIDKSVGGIISIARSPSFTINDNPNTPPLPIKEPKVTQLERYQKIKCRKIRKNLR